MMPTPEPPSSTDRPDAPGDGLAARQAAFDLLHQVLIDRRALDEALDRHKGLAEMPSRDRAFARLLTGTTLRRLGQIDALIGYAVTRTLPRQAAAVRDVLRLGIAQLIFLQTPRHAAVSTSVALCEMVKIPRFKGLVNAVLRRLADEGPALIGGMDAPRINTPDWLWEDWCAAYGEKTARAIATAHLNEAPLDFTVARDPEHWAPLLEASILPTGSLRRTAGGIVNELPGFDDGAWWVQDMAAALPVKLMYTDAGTRVLDMCAAPGGKAAQLAMTGAEVTALDRSARRLEVVRRNLHRLGLSEAVHLEASDALLWQPDSLYDAVLLDAPCTATGTIRRHPDIPRSKSRADVGKMAQAQARLLEKAVDLVRPGGVLVWCTCSLQPEEAEAQIKRLLAAGAPVTRDAIRPEEIGGMTECVTTEGEVRTLPCHEAALGGMDGFHIARLRRTSS